MLRLNKECGERACGFADIAAPSADNYDAFRDVLDDKDAAAEEAERAAKKHLSGRPATRASTSSLQPPRRKSSGFGGAWTAM
jgi:hypothetical protein